MIDLLYFTPSPRGSTNVHSDEGWLHKRSFNDPDRAFSALVARWERGDLEAHLNCGHHTDLTLGIQYDHRHLVGTSEFRRLAKALYDERIEFLIGGGERP